MKIYKETNVNRSAKEADKGDAYISASVMYDEDAVITLHIVRENKDKLDKHGDPEKRSTLAVMNIKEAESFSNRLADIVKRYK